MKKLKLLGMFGVLLLIPNLALARQSYEVDLSATTTQYTCVQLNDGSKDANTGIWNFTASTVTQSGFPSTGTYYVKEFKSTNYNGLNFEVKNTANGKSSYFSKLYATSTSKNRLFYFYMCSHMNVTVPEGEFIESITFVMNTTEANSTNASLFNVPGYTTEGATTAEGSCAGEQAIGYELTYTPEEATGPQNSLVFENVNPATVPGSTATANKKLNLVKIIVNTITEDDMSATPEPPQTYDFKTTTPPSDWTFYSDSDSDTNPWSFVLSRGMQTEDTNGGVHDFWAVSPKLKLVPGTYTIRMDINVRDDYEDPVEQKICLTKSSDLPTASTVPFETFSVTKEDPKVELDDNTTYLKTTLKAELEITNEEEVYLGIYDKSCQEGGYSWSWFSFENFSIKKVEEQFPAWDSFAAQGTKVTAKGNYDVQLKNAEGITLTYGGENLDVTVNTSSDKAELTGFEELNGDYNTVTLSIPEGAFETDLKNAYPAVTEQTIDIAYDMQNTTYEMKVNPAENRVQITMSKNYGKTEKTAQFKLNLKDYSTDNVISALEVGDLTTVVGPSNDYISFTLPTLEAGDYTLELLPMSLRSCNTYTSTGHTPWMMNKNVLASGRFTITGTVTFNDEDGNYFETIDDTYVILKNGVLDSNKNVIIPESVEYDGKTYYIKEIGEGAFKNKEIKEVKIPALVTTIGKEAFDGAYIENLTIPASVVVIGESAFNGACVLDLYLDNTSAEWAVVSKGENAFAGNAFLYSYVHYPAGSDVNAYNDLDVDDEYGAFFPTHFVRGTESSLDINDGNHYYCIGNPATTVNVTYNRSYNGKWAGLFLPFEVKLSTITDLGGEAAELYKFDDERGLVWVKLAADAQTPNPVLKANTPYLVKMPANELDQLTTIAEYGVDLYHHNNHGRFSLVNGEFKIVDDDADTSDCKYFLYGTFTTKTDMAYSNAYAIASSDGNFHKASSDAVTLKPYRIFLVENPDYVGSVSNVAGAPIRCSIISKDDDTPTYVEGLEVEVLERDAYYDLQGNKVMNPERGVYILNGKKVVIK